MGPSSRGAAARPMSALYALTVPRLAALPRSRPPAAHSGSRPVLTARGARLRGAGAMVRGRISRLSVRDVRFPTSLGGHGSDAMVSAACGPGPSRPADCSSAGPG